MSCDEVTRKRLEKEKKQFTAASILDAASFDIENGKLFKDSGLPQRVKAVQVMVLVETNPDGERTYRLEEYFFNASVLDRLFMLEASKVKVYRSMADQGV